MKIEKKRTLTGTKIKVTSDDGITVHTTDFNNNKKEALRRAQQAIEFQRLLRKNSGK